MLTLVVGASWGQEKELENVKKEVNANKQKIDSLENVIKLKKQNELIELESQKKKIEKSITEIKSELEERGTASRISFIIGLGSSIGFDDVYQMPVVSAHDNKVKIEKGQRARTSASFGIVYTPHIYRITDLQNPEGFLAAKGFSMVAFFNPLNFVKSSNLEENFSISNFGVGAGYKTVSGIAAYVVGELYSIKQPREWFINEFANGDKSYELNGQIQHSFTNTDESIFRNKLIPYVGIKVCYTFDIIKSFATSVPTK
ncbi:hypothetical protein HXZ94_01485 [Empedobacter falsenii]|uniref:hypothetical protein n=1 Tax=Empedobacter falsenii TaxID=343874 RepID=UPI0025762647|nr:hypothetical protein [Empedobacter falsenii]MDM1297180.1 hypothetical protein [Empedobacter falsenii]MDM1316973.1 hypothetical protein [Empedobacter falsenii]